MLQPGHRIRRPRVILAAQAERVVAAGIQHSVVQRVLAVCVLVPLHRFAGDLVEAGAFDRAGGTGEALFDERGRQPDGVEDLRAAVGLVGGDAHLGHHLHDALADRLQVVLLHLIGLLAQLVLHADLLQRLEREVRVDRLRAVARKHAEMVHLARLAGLHHQARAGAQSAADQVVMHRRSRQQCRHRDARGGNRTIRQDQDVVAIQHRIGRFAADAIDGPRHAGRALACRPGHVDRLGAERIARQRGDRPHLLEVGVGQDRLCHLEPIVRPGMMAQQVRPRADHRHQRHHQCLADRIDRRIGDLREVLLEIVVQQFWLVRQHGERRVGAHRAHRVVAFLRHRLEEELDILLRVAERLLLVDQRGLIVRPCRRHLRHRRRRLRRLRQILELHLRGLQPVGIRMLARELLLHLGVVDDAAFLEVDQQHLARLQPPLADDALLRHRQHARLRRHDHMVVVGDDIARRAQAVAIQRGTDLPTVGEGDRRRSVPRLHQRGIIFVERAPVRIHQRVLRPCLRDQQHHRMRQRVTAGDQDLQRIVDTGGIRLPVRDQRPHLVEVRADQLRGHRMPTRIHPVDVAADGVDLAVMRQEAIRMRQAPGRERVGGETLMHQRQRRLGQRVAQVKVEGADLWRQQQALVDDGARGERGHIELAEPWKMPLVFQSAHIVQCLLADRQYLPLECVLVLHFRAGHDDRLTDHRHRLDDPLAQPGRVGGDLAPAEERLPFGGDVVLEQPDRELPRPFVLRQKAHRHGVATGRRQGQVVLLGPVAQEPVGHLDQAAGPVPHQRVGTDCAAMIQVDQDLQPAPDDFVRLSALDVGDEAHAARVVLVAWIIQSWSRRGAHHHGAYNRLRRASMA